jgi:hypothetical protein
LKTPSAGSASARRLTVVVDVVVDDVGGPTVNIPIFGEVGVLSALVCCSRRNTFRIMGSMARSQEMGATATAEESLGVDSWALGPKWLVTEGLGVTPCGAPCVGS